MMTRNVLCWAAALLGICLWAAAPAMAQEHPKGEHPKGEHPKGEHPKGDEGKKSEHPGGDKAMEEAWAKSAEVGPHHAELKSQEGTWDAVVREFMDPSQPPKESKATEEDKLILGGRYLQFNFHGTMMEKPFDGLGLLGYDNLKKKHSMLWMDSMSTTMFYAEGDCADGGKTVTYVGESENPMGGPKQKTKYVTKEISADEHVLEMWMTGPDGKEFKGMEINFKRHK